MARAFGAVFGIAVNTAAVPAGSTVAGDTPATSGSLAIAFSRPVRRLSSGFAGLPSLTLTSSGPFVPAPKPSVIRS